MKAIDLDQVQAEQLAKKLSVRREHLDTIRRGGLHELGEGRDCPPLHLGDWAGADLWDRGAITENEARYLDAIKVARTRRKVEGWLKAWSVDDLSADFPGKVERNFEVELVVNFADVCRILTAETQKAKLFLLEVLESLQSEGHYHFKYEKKSQSSHFPDRLVISLGKAAED